MRPIDADALKELFSEVIGHIAKKPEMNGNLEHMVRASAMVIQMIDDAPTVQPETNSSEIPNNSDLISRQQAIDDLCAVCGKACDKSKFVYDAPQDEQVIICPEHYCLCTLPSVQPTIELETAKRIVGKSRGGMTLWYQCDTCHEPVDAQDNYCRGCGRRLIDEID